MKALRIGLIAAALALGAGCMTQRVSISIPIPPLTDRAVALTITITQAKPVTTNPAATVTAKGNTVPVSAVPGG